MQGRNQIAPLYENVGSTGGGWRSGVVSCSSVLTVPSGYRVSKPCLLNFDTRLVSIKVYIYMVEDN